MQTEASSRRTALYFSWDAPRECAAELGGLEERFPALFELRRVAWPHLEGLADPTRFNQGLPGFLEHIILGDFKPFAEVVQATTGQTLTIVHRVGLGGAAHPLDDAMLAAHDTVIIASLDHLGTEQRPSNIEVAAVSRFLDRPESRLIICPHHQVGADPNPQRLAQEHAHHGDPLVPARQRLGGYAHALLAALDLPVTAQFGLRPAVTAAGEPAPLRIAEALDRRRFLRGVVTFNQHAHLPHLEVPSSLADQVHILAYQAIAPDAPAHPFTSAGHREFNALVWAPPQGERRGDVLVGDATLFSAAFGGRSSLRTLWGNLVGPLVDPLP